jgi:hypothetical protein
MSNGMELVRLRVEQIGISKTARELGVSRTLVSLANSGTYPASTRKLEERALALYSRLDCPHLGQSITAAECEAHAIMPMPRNNPLRLAHWKACRACPMNRNRED